LLETDRDRSNSQGRPQSWLLLLLLVLGTTLQASQFQIEVDVDLVNVNFSATDRSGRMITGLTVEDFKVEEDGKPQRITQFARERQLPLTLGLLVDISPSVVPVLEEERRTASAFLQSILGPRDLAMVISFNRDITLVQDFTEDTGRLTAAVRDLRAVGEGTSMYDAVYLAADEKLSREAGRKAIILISDGDDTTSEYNASKAMIAVHRSNAVIYSLSIGEDSRAMRRMAEETGGASFRIQREGDFQKVFDQIASELRTQYSLAYHSTNSARDGAFRRIRIIPRDSRVNVRARRGYYAAGERNGN
jgi:VWFA-related protein